MKKLLFLFVFINGLTFSQMRPGIDYMPQIAFFDLVVNYFGLILSESGLTELKNFQD
ncbi:MAG: hypothetical protein J0L60_04110 [Ignavibacteria bacterium]|nr:hypothetical protein [Ignavibacteria bacterium]